MEAVRIRSASIKYHWLGNEVCSTAQMVYADNKHLSGKEACFVLSLFSGKDAIRILNAELVFPAKFNPT